MYNKNFFQIALFFFLSFTSIAVLATVKPYSKTFKQTVKVKKQQKLTPGRTCIQFLKWYVNSNTRKKARRFFTLNSPGDTTRYKVNFDVVNEYKNDFKKSGYVSDRILDMVQAKYDSASTYLKIHPQNDGPIMGFEDDPIIQLAEEGMLTDHIKSLKVTKSLFEDDYYFVRIRVSRYLDYVFTLTLHDKRWLIDSIVARF
jgi:hypothetical protein